MYIYIYIYSHISHIKLIYIHTSKKIDNAKKKLILILTMRSFLNNILTKM